MRGGDGRKYKDNITYKVGGPPGSFSRGGDVGCHSEEKYKAAGKVRDKNNNTYKSADDDVNNTNRSADGGGFNNTYKSADGGARNTGGGVRSSTNSRTIEVRFMIDVNRCRDFNLCMRLREFIVESSVMDPNFSILPLGENGGETITKPEEWPNTKEGIYKYYSHWSRQNNVLGK
jgi:hypothetical protein